ncbi:DUF4111 domain-containing protein [Pullulanibacillus sp. KACC 23026]|uniref:aminoglycoside adenylyltransferase domain-containing protein n=1 Tax=Pullulanibacillus sp. KACC 23026 TaxID=3028315 RepID=UPI0023AF9187|nr:aminoglycoside adenylyltransferase domain-containing protein [Pullulanibacillus sp. KACC 23026]WEG12558.1 DUF4111 domain-containing protein [Pullulanibacillus sp. KACC 23026]
MDSRIPSSVQEMLTDYLKGLEETFADSVRGVYLHGSLALNDFDSCSEVDFVSMLDHDLNCEEMALLTDLHSDISDKYPHRIMQGSYINWSDQKDSSCLPLMDRLRTENDKKVSAPYFDGFMMTMSAKENVNPVTWWVLKQNGIPLKGPEPVDLPFKLNEEDLVDYVYENMQVYWKKRVEKFWQAAYHEASLPQNELDGEVAWTVLGLLRQLYTLREQKVISKLSAADYGLQHLPEAFHTIIKEAVRIRKQAPISTISLTNEAKLEDTYKLSHYIFEWADLQQKSS